MTPVVTSQNLLIHNFLFCNKIENILSLDSNRIVHFHSSRMNSIKTCFKPFVRFSEKGRRRERKKNDREEEGNRERERETDRDRE